MYLKIKIKKNRTSSSCGFAYPSSWDAQKISVLAYEDHPDKLGKIVENCIIETDDKIGNKLLTNHPSEATNIDKIEADSLVAQYRPKPPEVEVTLRNKGKGIKATLENLLKVQGLKYRIKER